MQFIRPDAFLLLLLWLPFVFFYLRRQQQSGWQSVIAPELLKAFQQPAKHSKKSWQQWLLPTVLLLAIVALAGPAVTTKNQQSAAQGNLYVVLDNSLSMAATDVSPDRLTRAKRMLRDWTQSALFDRVSVLAYSGSAHLVTPLTSDVKTMEQQLSTLTPFIMPSYGNRADLAFKLLNEKLQENADTNAHVLWISDDISKNKLNTIRQNMPAAASLTFVPVGTESGSPIPLPDGRGYLTNPDTKAMVIVKADRQQMTADAKTLGFNVIALGAEPTPTRFEKIMPKQISQLGTKELGYWLLIPIAALWLLQQKRGISLVILGCVFFAYPTEKTYAASWFKNAEQQAYEALKEGKPKDTLELSKDPMLSGEAAYQSGDYSSATELFSQAGTVEGQFNQANSLVQQQKLQEAVKLYQEILAQQDHAGAKKNLALVEEFLKQNQSQDSQNNQEQQKNENQENQQSQQQQDSSQNDQSQQKEQQPSQDDRQENDAQQDQQSADEKNKPSEQSEKNEQQHKQQQNDEQNEDDLTSEEQAMQAQKSAEELRQDQEVEALLNQLENSAGSVLQQKFRYQYQQNPTDADDTLW